MGYLSKILSAVGVASTIPFASPQNNALTRPIGGLEGTISTCAKGGVKLCQTNHTHYLWDGELYDDSGEKIILNKDGAPIASGRWSYRGLENTAYNCSMEGVKECYTNNKHYILNKKLFIKNPDGNLVPSEQPKDEAIKGEEVNLAQLKEQVDALAKENDLILAKVRKRDYETASIKGLEGYVTPIIADAPAPSAQTQAKEDDLILAKAREDEITKLNAFLSPKKGLEGDVIPFIPDAPAPSAQKQLLFGYDQNFLTSSAIAMSAGTFVFYFPFANRVYNQALTNFVERQVLAQLALVTAAAATATEPQS